MRPRLIRCSSSSERRLSALSRSASASNTVQRDVNATSSAEQDHDQHEQADDGRVHRFPSGRRARSEISSSSASSTKLATIEEPP